MWLLLRNENLSVLDDSPAGRRRWCSMAVCGNRSKAAAHRQAAPAAAGTS
jgi:predicted RNA-binding Zn ribbon-like protein